MYRATTTRRERCPKPQGGSEKRGAALYYGGYLLTYGRGSFASRRPKRCARGYGGRRRRGAERRIPRSGARRTRVPPPAIHGMGEHGVKGRVSTAHSDAPRVELPDTPLGTTDGSSRVPTAPAQPPGLRARDNPVKLGDRPPEDSSSEDRAEGSLHVVALARAASGSQRVGRAGRTYLLPGVSTSSALTASDAAAAAGVSAGRATSAFDPMPQEIYSAASKLQPWASGSGGIALATPCNGRLRTPAAPAFNAYCVATGTERADASGVITRRQTRASTAEPRSKTSPSLWEEGRLGHPGRDSCWCAEHEPRRAGAGEPEGSSRGEAPDRLGGRRVGRGRRGASKSERGHTASRVHG